MPINMSGHIDVMFRSTEATRTTTPGSYVDGIWMPGTPVVETFTVNVQQVSPQELNFLTQGGERVLDLRRIYVNDGPMENIDETGVWHFLDLDWKTVSLDNRAKFGRKYCKIIVSRVDDQS